MSLRSHMCIDVRACVCMCMICMCVRAYTTNLVSDMILIYNIYINLIAISNAIDKQIENAIERVTVIHRSRIYSEKSSHFWFDSRF